jgi:RNA polymerase sigma-70 factor, ECF subfamily
VAGFPLVQSAGWRKAEGILVDLPSTHYSLLRALAAGSGREQAWVRFDELYRPVIVAWCQRRGLQLADAENVTQELVLKLPEKLLSYDTDKGTFRAWLKTVVNHAVTDLWRNDARRLEQSKFGETDYQDLLKNLADPDAIDELSTAVEQRCEAAAAEICERVRSRVDPKSWEIVWAIVMENRDAAEVAEADGMQIGSVYRLKSRVKKMLEEEYFNVYGSPVRDRVS